MFTVLLIIFWCMLLVLTIPVLVFSLQILAAVLPGFKLKKIQPQTQSIAILIPAHNEEKGIQATLKSILEIGRAHV